MPTNPLERARDILVRPFSPGSLTLPNRVVMAPTWPAKVLAGRVDELTPFHGGLLGSLR